MLLVYTTSNQVYHRARVLYRLQFIQSKGRPSGGILVCVHKSMTNVTVYRKHDVEGILWLRFAASHANDRDLFLAACYFSPADATIWSRNDTNPFDTLYNDLLDISSIGNYIITGDLNARTGTTMDMAPRVGTDRHMDFSLPDEPVFTLPPRSSFDTSTNNFGQQLLQLCTYVIAQAPAF